MVESSKKIIAVVLSVLFVFMAMAVNSVSAAESYTTWTQSDSRWANKTLGACSDTMHEIGCAVTSVAIVAVHSQSASEENFNPGILCDYLSNNKGFDNYGNLYWGSVSGLVDGFTFSKRAAFSSNTKAGITNEIANYINQGYYIVLSVRNNGHWVAVDTVKNGTVYMFDPAQTGNRKLFDVYDPSGVLQVRLYKGKKAPAKVDCTEIKTQNYLTGHYETTSSLNVRALYNTKSDILTTIPKGISVVVTRVYNNAWGQVEYKGKTGWIYLEYTKYIEGNYTYKLGNYKVNIKNGVYLRRGIGTQSTAECLVPQNAVVSISLVSANWGRAKYDNKSGWICMEYVKYAGEAAETTTAVTTASTTTTTTVTTTTKASTTKAATTTAVTTTDNRPLIRGDVNRDGRFTKTDLIILNAYINEPEKVAFDRRYTLDVNADKVIDAKDSVYLMKIINNN